MVFWTGMAAGVLAMIGFLSRISMAVFATCFVYSVS